jgi:hypothetical protein
MTLKQARAEARELERLRKQLDKRAESLRNRCPHSRSPDLEQYCEICDAWIGVTQKTKDYLDWFFGR